jgi:hypothetical protein
MCELTMAQALVPVPEDLKVKVRREDGQWYLLVMWSEEDGKALCAELIIGTSLGDALDLFRVFCMNRHWA